MKKLINRFTVSSLSSLLLAVVFVSTAYAAPSASNITATSATLIAAINPNGDATTVWFEYGTTQNLGSKTANQNIGNGNTSVSITATLQNLTPNTTYYYKVGASNAYGTSYSQILSFTTLAQGGGSSTSGLSSSNITANSATLNALINPNGASTSAWFEYGTTQNLGNSTASQNLGSGNVSVNVNSVLNNLNQNTTYYYKVGARNSYGTSYSGILSFTTLTQGGNSSISGLSSSNITANSATLNALVNPNGAATSVWFEYGTTQALGSSTASQNAGSGNTAINIASNLQNLTPITTYYFRVGATNTHGTVYSDILSFTTLNSQSATPTAITNAASAIMATSVSLNASVNPNGYNTNAWFEYGTSQSNLNLRAANQSIGTGISAISVNTNIINLTPNTTYYFRVGASNIYNVAYGSVLSFVTAQQQIAMPTVTTNVTSSISATSVTLNGTVNPNSDTTNGWFEYSTTNNFTNPSMTTHQSLGNGNVAVNMTANLTGLIANTTYYYRAAAQNSSGTSYGSVLTFSSQQDLGTPTVYTNSANASTNSATLDGSITPNTNDTVVWFEYGQSGSFGNNTPSETIRGGSTQNNFNAYVSGLTPNSYYYYRAVAQNSYGVSHGNTLTFSTYQNVGSAPAVITNSAYSINQNSAVLYGSVNSNNSNSSVWYEYGTTQGLGSSTDTTNVNGGNASVNVNSTLQNLSANTTYYYRIAARNNFGVAYGNILNFATSNANSSTNNNSVTGAPIAITSSASTVSQSSALMNGFVNPNNSPTTAWFEWGPDASVFTQTVHQSIGQSFGSNYYSLALSNLAQNTTYYFRLAAQNSYGTNYGNILSFTTKSTTNSNGSSGNNSNNSTNTATNITRDLIVLTSSFDNDTVKIGDEVIYTVNIKNEKDAVASDATLRITLPNEVEYKNASFSPAILEGNNSVMFKIGTIDAKSQKDISIRIKVSDLANAEKLPFNSAISYGIAPNNTETKLVSAELKLSNASSLGASLLDTLTSLSGNWFVDLLLGAAVGFGFYHFFLRKKSDILA